MDGKLWVDVGLWGGVIPGNVKKLTGMLDAVLGFKAFLIDSGVEGFRKVAKTHLRTTAYPCRLKPPYSPTLACRTRRRALAQP
ncbi:MAG: hypothetical protein R3C68_18920 [Myxococcota bacterium]